MSQETLPDYIDRSVPDGDSCHGCNFLLSIDGDLHCGLLEEEIEDYNKVPNCPKNDNPLGVDLDPDFK